MVSKPRERGITSSNSQSSSERFPASTLAWIAAPSATTLSGSRLLSGSCGKTAQRVLDLGMRVAPPPSHSLYVFRLQPGIAQCFSGRRQCLVDQAAGDIDKSFRGEVRSTISPVPRTAVMRTSGRRVRSSLASRARSGAGEYLAASRRTTWPAQVSSNRCGGRNRRHPMRSRR